MQDDNDDDEDDVVEDADDDDDDVNDGRWRSITTTRTLTMTLSHDSDLNTKDIVHAENSR